MGVRAEEEEVALQKREKKKKNKRNKKTEDGFVAVKTVCGETLALQGEDYELGLGRIKKKGQKNLEDKKDGGCKEMDSQFAEKDLNDNDHTGSKSEKKKRRLELGDKGGEDAENKKDKKRKMTNLTEDFEKKRVDMGESITENKGESTSDDYKTSKPKDSRKKVKFSEHVEEVFPSSIAGDVGEEKEDNLVRGKRFTLQEDELIKDAVLKYIKDHNLGEKGTEMVLNCKKYKLRNCWNEIGGALPWRPLEGIYRRAHILLDRAETRIWTEDEKAFVIKFHEKHGPKWKALGEILGKNQIHVKDAWRRLQRSQRKRGFWSQDETQTLFDLVNMDLRMKVFEEKKSLHGMLRDDICWSVIGDKLGTRQDSFCCMKWYHTLASPMVKAGEWNDADDYRLLDELVTLDACCVEDVDWDNLLEHRSGIVCRKRWKQMSNGIGEHRVKSFQEQVEVLSKRYCPELVETREAIDSRTVVS